MKQTASSFDEILNRNKDIVFNLIFRLTGDYHLSEDLFQETFLKVYSGLSRFKGGSELTTWIYRIALNVFKDHVRKKNMDPLYGYESKQLDKLNSTDYMTPEKQFVYNIEKDRIQKKINALRNSLKIPVVLHYIEGFTVRQISAVTGRTGTDIKVSLHRARKLLKKGWNDSK